MFISQAGALLCQFIVNGPKPLKAWAVISFERFCDSDDMKRYITYMCEVLTAHGVVVENRQPATFGPVDPRGPGVILNSLQSAARASYKAGRCAPQLICIILPGR